jgi:hypothetical protein
MVEALPARITMQAGTGVIGGEILAKGCLKAVSPVEHFVQTASRES